MDHQAIKNRLEKNFKHKMKWAKRENINAFRIYDRDIPEYPYIVDYYNSEILVFDKTDKIIDEFKSAHLDHLLSAISEIFQIKTENIILKKRFIRETNQYNKLENKNKFLEVSEHQAKFLVNLYDYIDTGLFLDHRPLRQLVFKNSKNKKVLNLFSYTGTISVWAAIGEAKSVTSVDLSSTYMEWAKDNFNLNNLPLRSHNFIVEDVFKYLDKLENKFDLIVLDPPTFSNSKKTEHVLDIEEDHIELIAKCMTALSPDGELYFSCNKRKFKLADQLKTDFLVVDITKKSIPLDFHDQKIHHAYIFKKRQSP